MLVCAWSLQGAYLMLTGYIIETLGGFPIATRADVTRYNVGRDASQGQLDVEHLVKNGIVTELDDDGLPVATIAPSVPTSKIFSTPSLQQLEVGANKEGYWTGADQARTRTRKSTTLAHTLSHMHLPNVGPPNSQIHSSDEYPLPVGDSIVPFRLVVRAPCLW